MDQFMTDRRSQHIDISFMLEALRQDDEALEYAGGDGHWNVS
jgi:hypothetical protein